MRKILTTTFLALLLLTLSFCLSAASPPNKLANTKTLTITYDGNGDCMTFLNGSVTFASGTFQLEKDSTVSTMAYKRHTGWQFDHWILDKKIVANDVLSLTMNRDHTVVAVFLPYNYTISFTADVGGHVSPSGDIVYPVMPQDAPSQRLTATAYADSGYQFDHWLWDGNTVYTSNPVVFGYNANVAVNHTLQAFFRPVS